MKELEKRCGEKNFENLKFKILEKRCWLVGLGSGAGWPFRESPNPNFEAKLNFEQ